MRRYPSAAGQVNIFAQSKKPLKGLHIFSLYALPRLKPWAKLNKETPADDEQGLPPVPKGIAGLVPVV